MLGREERDVEDPDAPSTGKSMFVDRVSEVEALRRAVLAHRARMDAGLIDTTELRNVLTFYGEGGAGKSELSRQLQEWVSGAPALDHWPEPDRTADVVVRWDLNDSFGVLDPHRLLVALRSQLGTFRASWPAFDLAFAAFHHAVQPGTELTFRSPGGEDATISDLVTGLLGDALSLGGMAVTGGASAGIVGIGRRLVSNARRDSKIGRLLRDYPGLEDLVADAEALQSDREKAAEIAGRLMFMLNREIEAIEATKRPTIVVFVDHMERLQVTGSRHLGEGVLNRLVSRAPWILFVVSGRNSLRWHEVSDFPASGPTRWPLLSTEDPPVDEPRQHSIGFLSPSDAREFLQGSFERIGVSVEPGVIAELVESSDGWPLHLQTVLTVAQGRKALGRPLTSADVGGSFPAIVERLLSDLPVDVANAFRAACLLPYFDVAFVVAAGQVSAGAVEQLLDRQLHRPNEGSSYRHRIHDALRALVRSAGSKAAGGWGETDWARHSLLALAEAQHRFDLAIDEQDDLGAIESLALGLNVATENNIFDPWLVVGIRRSPTIQWLAPRISASPRPDAPTDLADVLEFLRLRSRPRGADVTPGLREIYERRTAISSTAGLWRAYDLRSKGRLDEALEQIQDLIDEFDDRPALYMNQYVTTLRLARRFEEASVLNVFLSDAQQAIHRSSMRRSHGMFEGSTSDFERRISAAGSRRFQLELIGDHLAIQHREAGVAISDVEEMYGTALRSGHRATQAVCLGLLAECNLFDEQIVSGCLQELDDLSRARQRFYNAIPRVLAMRSLAIGDESLAVKAWELGSAESHRGASWIPIEILLEHLGHPLDPVDTQWLEPYGEVKQRWLGIFERIIERARTRPKP